MTGPISKGCEQVTCNLLASSYIEPVTRVLPFSLAPNPITKPIASIPHPKPHYDLPNPPNTPYRAPPRNPPLLPRTPPLRLVDVQLLALDLVRRLRRAATPPHPPTARRGRQAPEQLLLRKPRTLPTSATGPWTSCAFVGGSTMSWSRYCIRSLCCCSR
jgi:hypothetical protein